MPEMPQHYPWILIAILLVTGGVVAFQVFRIRTLNRYFERQTARHSGQRGALRRKLPDIHQL